ncbi:polyphosphate kinase [Pelagirhabdus alkalitolerans]|uniref:Polyphosphate kinase n=1 Tax=Pelagirhabdus alkalitolerans TaxID=1612202 RepID=A0A1G6IH68_9BACI|nr:RNA degradosome polyphosphate kinase [Pelagirhabdus alkalitolerans]SDC05733.1 polyphosphate kinase [Pelagirhabdus alkalitolerans]
MSLPTSLSRFDQHDHFINRELSWLQFNYRVLEESMDPSNPLLERARFLSIFTSNLDEFFMVRVAGLKERIRHNYDHVDSKSGLSAKEQVHYISVETHKLIHLLSEYYDQLLLDLRQEDIHILKIDQLTETELNQLETYFDQMIYPVLTALAIDITKSLPLIANHTLNVAATLSINEQTNMYQTVIVQVPALLNRLIQIKSQSRYVLLEDVITHFSAKLFTGYSIKNAIVFRITRSADLTFDEGDTEDILRSIEQELKKRDWGQAVRLEVNPSTDETELTSIFLEKLQLRNQDIYTHQNPIDLSFLNELYDELKHVKPKLCYPPLCALPATEVNQDVTLFDQLLERDLMIHHPYESFETVVNLLDQAASDDNILAIKQTLYRVSGDSPIIHSLKRAARAGKQVTVLVELKARFDEANNVQWARMLEKEGCHVILGVKGLKTHSKITLVVRRQSQGIQQFVHLSTGNYNDQTAKFYTDISLLTSREALTSDATHFFNYLSGFSEIPIFNELSMAPATLLDDLLGWIDEEIDYHKKYQNGRIIAKMNALTDKTLILKLYEASSVGVEIDLIVRGICCLKPGIEGVSDTITVHSIVGRFLEHSRVYYFHHNGNDHFFLGSADWMTRNMSNRIELLFPIIQPSHKKRLDYSLNLALKDNTKRRILNNDGSYRKIKKQNTDRCINSQEIQCIHPNPSHQPSYF